IVAKATLITVGALLASRLARKIRASVRHLIFAGGFVILRMLPLARAFVPAVEVPVALPEAATVQKPSPATTQFAVASIDVTENETPLGPAAAQAATLRGTALFLLLWAATATMFLLPI